MIKIKYKIYVSGRVLEDKNNDGNLDWMEDTGKDHLAESHNTLKECFDSMAEWGSKWVMYPSVYITTDKDGEIWESTSEYVKCKCCNHETWGNLTSFSLPLDKKDTSYKRSMEIVQQGVV